MKIKRNHVPTFHLSTEREGDKRYRILDVAYRKRITVSTEKRDARNAAERARLRLATHFGIDEHFDTLPTSDGAVRICWLEYRDDEGRWTACLPDIDAGDQYSLLVRGMALLKKMGDAIERKMGRPNRALSDETFADPAVVLRTLRASRDFTEVERFEVDRRGYWIEPAHERVRTVEVAS